ncbi:MAG: hypothetical protein E7580_01435 [Ruminococcaceae bacterium]|nr:hypothetical protein [Oscillospiraceae bacterium]
MKRILALALALFTLLPLCACTSGSLESTAPAENAKTAEQKKTAEKAPEKTELEKFDMEKDLPEGYAVGYGIADVTGTVFPLSYYGGSAVGASDPLMLTCVAMSDGENVALVMTIDLKKMYAKVFNQSLSIIEKNFGIPAENVIISSTHSHSAPDAGEDVPGNIQWVQQYYKKLYAAVNEALHDLDPVEHVFTGKANEEHPIGYVRRYYMADGSFKTIASSNPCKDFVAHESVADPEFRTIRFDRKNKKDVLMVNFQTHYGGQVPANMLSADFVHPFRKQAQEEWDCLFAYYSGAGGNINFKSEIPGERYYEEPSDAIAEFMGSTQRAMDAEEEAALGKVSCARSMYPGKVRHDPEERVKQAQEVVSAGYETEKGISLMAQYGFDSHFEPAFIVTRSRLGETLDIPMTAVSFGEIAFTGHPYEMFHENGKEVRDGSPFKTTFICSLSGDALGYIPSALGYSNGGYETFNCRFAAGTGEELAQEAIRLLNQCKNAA